MTAVGSLAALLFVSHGNRLWRWSVAGSGRVVGSGGVLKGLVESGRVWWCLVDPKALQAEKVVRSTAVIDYAQ